MRALGYVVLEGLAHSGRPPIAQRRYLERIPGVYREAVLKKPPSKRPPAEDPHRLGIVKQAVGEADRGGGGLQAGRGGVRRSSA